MIWHYKEPHFILTAFKIKVQDVLLHWFSSSIYSVHVLAPNNLTSIICRQLLLGILTLLVTSDKNRDTLFMLIH